MCLARWKRDTGHGRRLSLPKILALLMLTLLRLCPCTIRPARRPSDFHHHCWPSMVRFRINPIPVRRCSAALHGDASGLGLP
ncbi:hypothetical protein SEVIR_6G113040v4 [Setaria viridis]|nr:hypothetical protein SEVIR_6G113040v2 [Setaria viridis]